MQEASDLILVNFERPEDQSATVKLKRAGYGQVYYNKYATAAIANVRKEGYSLKLIRSILTKNPCYTTGRKIVAKGLMLHSVGVPQSKASVFINSWNSPNYNSACVHAFIDAITGYVYQTLPWNYRGWHCGSGKNGSGNNSYIGIEMCEPSCIKYTSGSSFTCSDLTVARAAVARTYNSAVELFAMLCKQFNLNPLADGVIISHREGHARGIASNHGDPEHLWNGLGMGYTMNGFRQDVKAAMNGGITVSSGASTDLKSTVIPYTVRITATDLNIRSGPGTNYVKVGYITPSVYTIIAEGDGPGASKWGKLKSGIGWVSLDYCKKLD